MKKTLCITISVIAILIAASVMVSRPKVVDMSGVDIEEWTFSQRQQGRTDTSKTLKAELDYYLERHNVQDEGYEMVVGFANGHRHEVETGGRMSVLNIGTWQGHERRGAGLALDSLGRTIVGKWEEDSLATGIRLDSMGTYTGDFSHLKAKGHGAYFTPDGSYFEGHWEENLREGFGLEAARPENEEHRLRVGEWTKDVYKGERMKYTTERIYGIDVARYQHGKGRKKYGINWKQMRITYLGKRGHKNVSGTADYPVSFIFIKSTEGTSIRNPHYAADYQQARREGIHTGAYHFFSTRTGGAAQAQYFLRFTRFNTGDLPPVLDVEPSDLMIRQLGGPEKLFEQIRIWLKTVEQRVGVKPILYVNQRFVNMYLSQAPDIKRDYRVWIARYGEYKPDVHLAFWQLCPDGRVAGIRGDVDINVFNGYRSQFEEFLEEETIR